MATLILQAVGGAVGGVFGPIGAAVGSALGASAGYAIDQTILNGGKRIEGARLSSSQPMTAEDGAAVPRVYGYCRLSTTVIWATRLQEHSTTERQGAKGGPRVTTYSYSASAAFAICEGRIAALKRIWADGKELDLRDINYRFYHGDEDQLPDPLIELKQGKGNAPSYRGTAYLVIENLALERFGNRIPQIQVEVVRPVGKLENQIKAVTIIPSATEYGYAPEPVVLSRSGSEHFEDNRHILFSDTDWKASIDELQAVCPNVEHVSLVVAWYCDDLRAEHAKIRPGVIRRDVLGAGDVWSVGGFTRIDEEVHLITKIDGRSVYGGTPSDLSVIDAIIDLKARGLKVTLNPFILMDIPPDNALSDPYGGTNQAAFPWRGRITTHPAIGQPSTADKTALARNQIDAFCGATQPSLFGSMGSPQIPNQLADFGYRQFILHNAALAQLAGGVDTFLIGSEMRGLSWVRDQANAFPFVGQLRTLAADVRQILSADTQVLYGSDWSEYFGYHPADGSGDVFFHLDPLWADPNISAVGIDNYMPLSDWREADSEIGHENPDGARWSSDADALERAIAAGEGFDWYYASDADRLSRQRTPIADGAYSKPWTYRYKDLVSWWSNPHFNRIGGIEAVNPTDWQPQSKPIYFTELGCPAVHAGANQPNVFIDPKSSESQVPYASTGARDDFVQRAYLTEHHTYWTTHAGDTRNPNSNVTGLPMVPPDRLCVWTWDARPLPAFPVNKAIWGDGDNWLRGHWINGRMGTVPIADLVDAVFADHGLPAVESDTVGAVFSGIVLSSPASIRGTLEPVLKLAAATVDDSTTDETGSLPFRVRGLDAYVPIEISAEDRVDKAGAPILTKTDVQIDELPNEIQIFYRDPIDDYQSHVAHSRRIDGDLVRLETIDAPAIMEEDNASQLAEKLLAYRWAGRKRAEFSLPLTYFDLKCGDVIFFSNAPEEHWLLERLTFTDIIEVSARSISKPRSTAREPRLFDVGASEAQRGNFGGPPEVVLLDLPLFGTDKPEEQFRIAARSTPIRQLSVFKSPGIDGFQHVGSVNGSATLGTLNKAIAPSHIGRFDDATTIELTLPNGELESVSTALLLNGSNTLAVQAANGEWEIIQYSSAEEVAPATWRLSKLLRGQAASDHAMQSGAPIGAQIVKLDRAVVPIGIADDEVGLTYNFKVGQTGKELTSRYFRTVSGTGGVASLMPLSPVHLRASNNADGSVTCSWIRRGRVNADSWLGPDIPLGEELERYSVEFLDDQQNTLATFEADEPEFNLSAAETANLYGADATEISLRVCQISQRVGNGHKATKTIQLS